MDYTAGSYFRNIRHIVCLIVLCVYLSIIVSSISITGNCLAWFHSYLTNRSQKVLIHGTTSLAKQLSSGV